MLMTAVVTPMIPKILPKQYYRFFTNDYHGFCSGYVGHFGHDRVVIYQLSYSSGVLFGRHGVLAGSRSISMGDNDRFFIRPAAWLCGSGGINLYPDSFGFKLVGQSQKHP